ncbi:ATP-dependent DNA helicase [Spiribacter halobius]|uniref:DNA 5'-3' helicase n=1 Tax=Sediminicurvatus halobius TaxID=2182432 RepID=A0A2U2N5H0_9GAMM|nr:ATP-dependent DNA helicase [Spiribacter halobius]PWG64342.1 helicase [Spiribacter halobius]UEX79312.1 ATP-dependent DNA helicase [Spiribacter halobius]
MTLSARVAAALAEDGELARAIPDYEPRAEQQAMAEAVAGAIEAGETLVAEAGTGTGKTFAYLVPALLAGRRVVISTGTRTLQDQLYHRDLPLVTNALERPVRRALLKGRTNYLCPYRTQVTAEAGRLESRALADRFQRLREWAGRTRSGDLAEAPDGTLDPMLLPRVTSTADNCLGQECPLYSDCFLMEARRRAQEADVVVVNHHLLMADWAVREGGYGEVLPGADVYILDEAHQLPETAAQFFGLTISSRQLQDLARDTRAEQLREAGDSPALGERAGALERAAAELRLALGPERREAWSLAATAAVIGAAESLLGALDALVAALEPQAPRGKGLEACHRRSGELAAGLRRFLGEAEEGETVRWLETRGQGFSLRLTPLSVAGTFHAHMQRHPAAWVFTSATLSVGGRFEHFTRRLGLESPRTLRVDSPFDYRRNALLYVPAGLPEPSSPGYLPQYLEQVAAVLRASRGRAFLLFTSHRALAIAADTLAGRVDHPLLVQGEAGQQRLLERFRAAGDAVLLGTQSFWEGVDVRGEALSCVMIDRLPFGSPGDPVTRARIEALRADHGNPFAQYQLPEAVITLRQGVGRLIRDASDRGVLVIGDGRLVQRSYGRVFRESLPPMPLTRRLEDVEAFFAA